MDDALEPYMRAMEAKRKQRELTSDSQVETASEDYSDMETVSEDSDVRSEIEMLEHVRG